NGASDYENVHAFQHGMRLIPLSQFPGQEQKPGPPPGARQPPSGPTPPERVKAMDPVQFFTAFANAMKKNPPHADDAPLLKEMASVGISPGQDFDASHLTPEQLAALKAGTEAAMAHLESF